MSLDQLAFIIEKAYQVKYHDWVFGKVISFRLHEGEDYQQIEIEHSAWKRLKAKHQAIIEKWEVTA